MARGIGAEATQRGQERFDRYATVAAPFPASSLLRPQVRRREARDHPLNRGVGDTHAGGCRPLGGGRRYRAGRPRARLAVDAFKAANDSGRAHQKLRLGQCWVPTSPCRATAAKDRRSHCQRPRRGARLYRPQRRAAAVPDRSRPRRGSTTRPQRPGHRGCDRDCAKRQDPLPRSTSANVTSAWSLAWRTRRALSLASRRSLSRRPRVLICARASRHFQGEFGRHGYKPREQFPGALGGRVHQGPRHG